MSLAMSSLDRLLGGRLAQRDFERRFDRYLDTNSWRPGDGEALLSAFLGSAGKALTAAAEQTTAVRPSYDFAEAQDVLGLWSAPGSLDRALSDLRAQGFALLDARLSDDLVETLSDTFAQAPCTLTSDRPITLPAGETVTVDFEAPLAEKYAVTTRAALNSPTVRSLLLDRGLLQIAQAYLGAAPTVDIVAAWYSFPGPAASAEAAQLFHFDLDRIRWLKVFFLLTDQDAETGAHVYVPGTHRDNGISRTLLNRGYARLEDHEVAAFHPQSGWRTMEGQRGVILLEDTRGLHKGLPVVRDHRLMLQFEYVLNLFGHLPGLATDPIDPIEDDYWARMKEAYPLLFEVINRD